MLRVALMRVARGVAALIFIATAPSAVAAQRPQPGGPGTLPPTGAGGLHAAGTLVREGTLDHRPKGAPPQGVTAQAVGPTIVALSWHDPSGALSFRIYRYAPGNNLPTILTAKASSVQGPRQTLISGGARAAELTGNQSAAAAAAAANARLRDVGLLPGSEVSYVVEAVYHDSIAPGRAEPVTVRIPAVPAVRDLAATVTGVRSADAEGYRVDVSWRSSPGASRYRVYRTRAMPPVAELLSPRDAAGELTDTIYRFADERSLGPTAADRIRGQERYVYGVAPGKYVYQVEPVYTLDTLATSSDLALHPGVPVEIPASVVDARAAGTAPGGLRAAARGPTSVELSWEGVPWATQYRLYRALGASGDFLGVKDVHVAMAGASSTQRYIDEWLTPGVVYRYRVEAFHRDSAPGVSEVVQVTMPVATPVAGLRARSVPGLVTLLWRPAPGAQAYVVFRDGARIARLAGGTATLSGQRIAPDTLFEDSQRRLFAASSFRYQVVPLFSGSPSEQFELNRHSGVSVTALPAPVHGVADLHTHQHANFAYGGLLVWGQSYGAPETALASDVPAHGGNGKQDKIGHTVRERNLHPNVGDHAGHPSGGPPKYDGWPTYHTYTHQQYYQAWLKRALDGGLKLIVMYAVNSEALCVSHTITLLGRLGPGRSCADMEAVDLQIKHAYSMQEHIDWDHGGPGKGWYRIVRSPREARQAIADGQLAVVLGIEVQSLFGCQVGQSCDAEHVRRQLDRYHAMGVRQLIPIHNANNLFGGTAIFRDQYNLNNWALSSGVFRVGVAPILEKGLHAGEWFDVGRCTDPGIGMQLSSVGQLIRATDVLEMVLPNPGIEALQRAAEAAAKNLNVPSYPPGGHCNALGLTPLGRQMLQGMMHRKMLLDIDHLSQKAFYEAHALAKSLARPSGYPLLASHTGLVDVSLGDRKWEFWKTRQQVDALRAGGGLLGLLLYQGRNSEVRAASKVSHDCSSSSKTWAQVYLTAASLLGPDGAVGIASDFGGFVPGPAPRFGRDACDGDGKIAEQANQVPYPFTGHGTSTSFGRSTIGERNFDYNTDGFAHIGMLPDFVQDLKNVGLTDGDLAPLFRSVEAYIRLWERVEATAVPDFPISVTETR